MQIQPGHLFENKYRIEHELGRGGFGVVYRAYQQGMDRRVAIKLLSSGTAGDAQGFKARERFLREVRIISKLRHPNTVTIHDFGETHDGLVYMVLEYIDGGTLKELVSRRGALDASRALRIALQIARALSEAHRHGIVHRDLKPANIMLSEVAGESDFVKVLDFGIARLVTSNMRSVANADLTNAGLPEGERELIGTPRYMSPEQVRGEELTGASDVYSLGLILYEMMAGEPAVRGDGAMSLITQQLSPEPLQLRALGQQHPIVQRLVMRATSKASHTRHRTVDELAHEIETAATALQSARDESEEQLILGNQYDMNWGQHTPSGTPAIPTHQSASFPHPGAPSGAHPSYPPQPGPSGAYAAQQPPHPSGAYPHHQSGPYAALHPHHVSGAYPAATGANPHHDPSTLSRLAPDLPVPPDPYQPSPFAEPEPLRSGTRSASVSEEEATPEYIALLITTMLAIPVYVATLYGAVIIVGAALDAWTEGVTRIAALAGAASVIVILPVLASTSHRERFRVVHDRLARSRRMMVLGSMLNLGVVFLCVMGMSAAIAQQLREAPNWMSGEHTAPQKEGAIAQLNRNASYRVADGVDVVSRAMNNDAAPVRPLAPSQSVSATELKQQEEESTPERATSPPLLRQAPPTKRQPRSAVELRKRRKKPSPTKQTRDETQAPAAQDEQYEKW